jgi:FMN phosphatase YigB (HAD superfamily)
MKWIGFDLDGTLARYDEFKGHTHIGEPIPKMVMRVLDYLEKGWEVRILTARACFNQPSRQRQEAIEAIENWTEYVFGQKLKVTSEKDFEMVLLYDDRCQRVERNTGELI